MAIIVPAIAGKVIHIGRAGEHLATTVTFDVSDWLEEFGSNGTFILYVQQGEGFYIQSIKQPTQPILGTQWVFNDIINVKGSLGHHGIGSFYDEDGREIVRYLMPQINFLNEETEYSLLNGKSYEDGREILFYDTVQVYNSGYWIKPGYKTIVVTGGVDQEDPFLLSWLNENATSSPLTFFPGNGLVEWDVTNANTGTIGLGKCELQYNVNGAIVKSIIYDIVVTNSLDMEAQEDPPDPIASWLNDVGQLLDDINNASKWAVGPTEATTPGVEPSDTNNAKYWAQIAQLHGNIEVGTTTTGLPGTNAEVVCTQTSEGWELDFTIPEGQQGTQGIQGIQGETGPQGPQGYGLTISGVVPNSTQLPSGVSAGTAFGVGGQAPYEIFISNGTSSGGDYHGWTNFGEIGGLQASLVVWTE